MARVANRVGSIFLTTLLAGTAAAEMPAALDRVPADAAVIAAVKNLKDFKDSMMTLAEILPDLEANMMMADMMLGIPGLNPEGSVALALMSTDEGLDFDEDGPIIMIVPITDYKTLITGLGAEPTGGIDEISMQGTTLFSKDLGGGFAAISPINELLASFDGAGGNLAAHNARIGKTGQRIGDDSDAFIIADIEALRPMIEGGLEQYAQMAMAMTGGAQAEQMKGQIEMTQVMAAAFVRDAQVAMFGLSIGDAGVGIDIGAQFKDGSELSGYFQADGNAAALLKRLPSEKYLFAIAADTSAESTGKLLAKLNELSMKYSPEAAKMDGLDPALFFEKADGIAMVFGQPVSLMGSMFSKIAIYAAAKDPQVLTDGCSEMIASLNGQSMQGMTFNTSYQKDATEINGTSIDSWTFSFKADPDVPGALNLQPAIMMAFGPTMGPSGFIARAGDGVVITLSQDATLMTKALDAAKNGNGLGADAGMSNVAEHLPANSSSVMFISVGNIIDTVASVKAMMGAPLQIEVPDDLQPIGIGSTTSDGGVRSRLFVPTDVLETLAQFKQVGGDPEADADGGKKLRY